MNVPSQSDQSDEDENEIQNNKNNHSGASLRSTFEVDVCTFLSDSSECMNQNSIEAANMWNRDIKLRDSYTFPLLIFDSTHLWKGLFTRGSKASEGEGGKCCLDWGIIVDMCFIRTFDVDHKSMYLELYMSSFFATKCATDR